MKVAIIGAGFAGLAAGIDLVDRGIEVEVFEADDHLGGLAGGFKGKNWKWSLERFYHHIFDNDEDIKRVSQKVGGGMMMLSPVTSALINGKTLRLDSPLSLLMFSEISLWSRIRMGVGLLMLKLIANGKSLERYKVVEVLPKLLGKEGYEVVWERLLKAKFGSLVTEVNLAWFWARVVKRTAKLGYFEGGFEALAKKMGGYIRKKGGKVEINTKVERVESDGDGIRVDGKRFDAVLLTVPAPLVNKIMGKEVIDIPKINYLWGQTLILSLDQSLMKDYWLNILERKWPFLVAVEHTNLVERSNYANKRLLYLGNYLEDGDERLTMSDDKLLKEFVPYLKKINKDFSEEWIKEIFRFQAPFAQPVFPVDFSKTISPMRTGIKGVYVANMSMVYPWDRGTNYAVKIGQEASLMISGDLK